MKLSHVGSIKNIYFINRKMCNQDVAIELILYESTLFCYCLKVEDVVNLEEFSILCDSYRQK